METQEFFKKWKSDFPKSFEHFENFMEENNFPYSYSGDIEFYYCGEYVLEFYLLTGIIHKFFFDNNINSQQIYYNYAITNSYILNQEIEKKAFLKAAEILEKELVK